ncbi:MAG: hypothetical protein AAFQ22_07225 [Pseudomonadota bacterium]
MTQTARALLAEEIDAVADARARLERMVHEAMLTWAVMPSPRSQSQVTCWPAYAYERNDPGAWAYFSEAPERPPWMPNPRQIDEAVLVDEWFSNWRGKDRRKNGIHSWERGLLTTRAWQIIFGKDSWRGLADAMSAQPHAPNRSYEWYRKRHEFLMDIAWNAGREIIRLAA